MQEAYATIERGVTALFWLKRFRPQPKFVEKTFTLFYRFFFFFSIYLQVEAVTIIPRVLQLFVFIQIRYSGNRALQVRSLRKNRSTVVW